MSACLDEEQKMLVRGWLCARLRSILGMGVVAPFLMVTGVHLTQAEQRPQPIANEKRVEAQDGISSATFANLAALKSAFESGGIEFIGTPEDGPGIRIRI